MYYGDEPKYERCAVMKIENMQLNLESDWIMNELLAINSSDAVGSKEGM